MTLYIFFHCFPLGFVWLLFFFAVKSPHSDLNFVYDILHIRSVQVLINHTFDTLKGVKLLHTTIQTAKNITAMTALYLMVILGLTSARSKSAYIDVKKMFVTQIRSAHILILKRSHLLLFLPFRKQFCATHVNFFPFHDTAGIWVWNFWNDVWMLKLWSWVMFNIAH